LDASNYRGRGDRGNNKTKNREAPGSDGILTQLLKYSGLVLVEHLSRMCNRIWEPGDIPRDWRGGIIIPLPQIRREICLTTTVAEA